MVVFYLLLGTKLRETRRAPAQPEGGVPSLALEHRSENIDEVAAGGLQG